MSKSTSFRHRLQRRAGYRNKHLHVQASSSIEIHSRVVWIILNNSSKYQDFIAISHDWIIIVEGFVDGNYRVSIYIHLLDLTRNSCEECNFRSRVGIEPAALRFRCSALKQLSYMLMPTKSWHLHPYLNMAVPLGWLVYSMYMNSWLELRQLASVWLSWLERCTGITGTQVRFLPGTWSCIFRSCFCSYRSNKCI